MLAGRFEARTDAKVEILVLWGLRNTDSVTICHSTRHNVPEDLHRHQNELILIYFWSK